MHPAVKRCNIVVILVILVILGNTWETDSSGAQALGAALAATSTLINPRTVGSRRRARRIWRGACGKARRGVSLTLYGVDLGRVAAQVGLGETAGG